MYFYTIISNNCIIYLTDFICYKKMMNNLNINPDLVGWIKLERAHKYGNIQ